MRERQRYDVMILHCSSIVALFVILDVMPSKEQLSVPNKVS